MKKKLTRKEQILRLLRNPETKLTCGEICKKIIKKEKLTGNVAHYLSGSVSSILNKLVKEGALMYVGEKGPLGGYVYQKCPIRHKIELKAIDFLRRKQILKQGNTMFLIKFEGGEEINLVELFAEFREDTFSK